MALDMKKLNYPECQVGLIRNMSNMELSRVNIPDFMEFLRKDMAAEIGVSLTGKFDYYKISNDFDTEFHLSGYFFRHRQLVRLLHDAFEQGLWEGRSGKRD